MLCSTRNMPVQLGKNLKVGNNLHSLIAANSPCPLSVPKIDFGQAYSDRLVEMPRIYFLTFVKAYFYYRTTVICKTFGGFYNLLGY